MLVDKARLDEVETAARAMCVEGGFDPDEIMPNDGARWRYYAPSAVAALRSLRSVRDRVKQLEWKRYWGGSDEQYRSWRPINAVGGFYRIDMDGDDWELGTCEGGKYASLDEAKAAAQADYEQRILSALEPSTTSVSDRVTDEMWTDLCELPDRTTPEGCDDMVMLTRKELECVLAALRTSPPEPASGWMSMDIAPKDGTEFQAWIVAAASERWEPRCRINPDTEAFEIWGRVDYDADGWSTYPHVTATHWQPEPTPPAKEPQ